MNVGPFMKSNNAITAKSKSDTSKKKRWINREIPMSEGGGGSFLVLCEHPDKERIVKRSIPSLIIDKHKGEGCEQGSKRKADSCGTCNSIS